MLRTSTSTWIASAFRGQYFHSTDYRVIGGRCGSIPVNLSACCLLSGSRSRERESIVNPQPEFASRADVSAVFIGGGWKVGRDPTGLDRGNASWARVYRHQWSS
jgi:hypothetical protein